MFIFSSYCEVGIGNQIFWQNSIALMSIALERFNGMLVIYTIQPLFVLERVTKLKCWLHKMYTIKAWGFTRVYFWFLDHIVTMLWKFITYSYGVQIMHAKMHWNPIFLANKIHSKSFVSNFRNSIEISDNYKCTYLINPRVEAWEQFGH